MNPEWKEVFTFDIAKDSDEVAIYIINNFEGSREILAEKRFVLNKIGEEFDDPLHELATQQRIDDILLISNHQEDTIG